MYNIEHLFCTICIKIFIFFVYFAIFYFCLYCTNYPLYLYLLCTKHLFVFFCLYYVLYSIVQYIIIIFVHYIHILYLSIVFSKYFIVYLSQYYRLLFVFYCAYYIVLCIIYKFNTYFLFISYKTFVLYLLCNMTIGLSVSRFQSNIRPFPCQILSKLCLYVQRTLNPTNISRGLQNFKTPSPLDCNLSEPPDLLYLKKLQFI